MTTRKKVFRIVAVVLAVAIICCLASAAAFVFMPIPTMETAATEASVPVPTSVPEAEASPTPTGIPIPTQTPVPAPVHLTVATFEQERSALTDIQKEQYDQDVLGEVIQFRGQVTEVSTDGGVYTDEGGLFTLVKLLGIPKDVAITLQKDQLIEGMGTVVDVDTFLILTIEIQVTSWNN